MTQSIHLPWGKEGITLGVPDSWTLVYPQLDPQLAPAPGSETQIVEAAVSSPLGAAPLSKRSLAGKKVVIITDDNTRPTPVYKFFNRILDILEGCGADLSTSVLIPALGIHTPMTPEEMADKVGEEALSRIPWENHQAFSQEGNTAFGTTSRGTPVALNSRLKEADLILLMGLIEPHLMAGFGGGLKNILPGVASAQTIGIHHQLLTQPPRQFNRVGTAPESNPFRLDLEEGAAMVKGEIFCLNLVIDHNHVIQAAFAGDPVAAHRAGVAYTRTAQGLVLDQKVDGVITNSFPMDINLKQSMKCVGNSLPALNPGGVVMGFLRAERGLDDIPLPDKMALPPPLLRGLLRLMGPGRVFGFLNRVKKGLNAEEKFLYYYMLQLFREHRLFLHVPTLSALEAQRLFYFTHCPTPQDVVDRALARLGPHARVAVFPKGGATYPILARKRENAIAV